MADLTSLPKFVGDSQGIPKQTKHFFLNVWFSYYMEIPCSNLTTRRENSIFHIRNRGSIRLIRIMGWMIMETHGFNDGRHWLSNGLSHVWCHAIICHAMDLSVGVRETNQLHLNRNTWVKIFAFSEYIGNCGLQNIDYKILLTIIPFNWNFCSII